MVTFDGYSDLDDYEIIVIDSMCDICSIYFLKHENSAFVCNIIEFFLNRPELGIQKFRLSEISEKSLKHELGSVTNVFLML